MGRPPRFTGKVNAELERTWEAIRARHADLPDVAIILGSGSFGRTLKWGHWGAARWVVKGSVRGEVMIAGELLGPGGGNQPRRPVEERVLGTILHEAAHGLAYAREIDDTSRDGRYHNRRFKALANEVGLRCQHSVYGWARTSLLSRARRVYEAQLTALRDVLQGFRTYEFTGFGTEKRRARICLACECGRKVYCAPGVARLGSIVCGVCEGAFSARPAPR